jgi:hypothetical protein
VNASRRPSRDAAHQFRDREHRELFLSGLRLATGRDELTTALRAGPDFKSPWTRRAPSPQSTPKTAAIAARASAPCRTSADDQRLCRFGL